MHYSLPCVSAEYYSLSFFFDGLFHQLQVVSSHILFDQHSYAYLRETLQISRTLCVKLSGL